MFFGVFGSIFLLAQFFQTAQGYSPLEAGLRTLPWTAMPMFVAPIAGVLADRIGSRPLMALRADAPGRGARLARGRQRAGHRLRAARPRLRDGRHRHGACLRPGGQRGAGSVRPEEAGQASGATNTIREIGGVLGVAVLASVFTSAGGYGSPQAFNDGLVVATGVGAGVVALGALATLIVPGKARQPLPEGRPEPVPAAA